ncbi:MAG: hypothetical protein HOH43_02995, partial [Candidatus Latescibacteria bacterium]|nr:hypothetical protein [Candidatus Latescibacterota bacterium]
MNDRSPYCYTLLMAMTYIILATTAPAIAQPGTITTLAGDGTGGDFGPADEAHLFTPSRVGFDTDGSIFISDPGDHRIRRVDIATSDITTVAGSGDTGFSGDGGAATAANLSFSIGVVGDASGNL